MRIQRGVGADSCRGWHCGGGPGRRSIDFEVRASEVRVARIRDIVFSEHALAQCVYRGIDVELVVAVALRPDHSQRVGPTREVRQAVVAMGGRPTLLRVVLDTQQGVDVVVTAYQTRKLRKYGGLQ
jgi:hypothetical protein